MKAHKIAKIRLIFLSLALALALLLTACGAQKTPVSGGEISFTDDLGRAVRLEKPPCRVAALLGSFADVWVLAGGELCAAAADAWEDFGLALESAVNIGGAHSPSLELLLSADPDFVLASASTAKDLEMKDTLEALGIPVAYFDVDSFKDYLRVLKICTEITGRADLYEKNGEALLAEIEQIKAQYKTADIPSKERRVLLLRASSATVKAKGSEGTVLGEMLADMGCVNIADGNGALLETLSSEAIIREDPYHIFVVTMGNDTEASLASLEKLIKEDPALSTLSAISGGRLHVMDKSLFNLKPNASWAESYRILYETLTQN